MMRSHSSTHYAHNLLKQIVNYHLDKRDIQIAVMRSRLENNRVNEGQARIWLQRIQPLVDEQERCFNPLPRAPDQDEMAPADIEVADVLENPGVRAGIRFTDRPRHIITCGATGSGKSTLLRRLITLIFNLFPQIALILFDFKTDFLHLPELLGRDRCKRLSFHKDLRIGTNPAVPLHDPTSWINEIASILAAQCGLLFSKGTIAQVIRLVLPVLNPKKSIFKHWPSIPLIYEVLEALPDTAIAQKGQYAQSARQQLKNLKDNAGDVFNTFSGFNVNEYCKPGTCLVLDLSLTDPLIFRLIVEIVCAQLLFSRLWTRHTVDTTEIILGIDESDQVCDQRWGSVYPEGYSKLGALLKQGREFGIMVMLGMQFLGQCSQFISANAHYHFIFQQTDPASRAAAAQTLNEPHIHRLLSSLQSGECIFLES